MDLNDIAGRLERRFGTGSDPAARRRLYARLAREVDTFGDPAYKILCDVALAASGARDPGRYFSAAVTRRLREAGYLKEGDTPDL